VNRSEQNIIAFAHLVKTLALTEADKTGLLQMLDTLQNSLEALSPAITKWCGDRSLQDALDDQYNELFPPVARGFGKSPTEKEGQQSVVDLLRNAIQTSVPPAKSIPVPNKSSEDPKPSGQKS